MSEHIRMTIAEAQRRLEHLEAQVLATKKNINFLCEMVDEPPRYPDLEASGNGPALSFRGDQFYGKSMFAAARELLKMRHRTNLGPATVAEIYAALVDGGLQFESKNDDNAKRILRAMLSKNSHTFHRLPSGQYGLVEWYPGIKAARDSDDEEGADE